MRVTSECTIRKAEPSDLAALVRCDAFATSSVHREEALQLAINQRSCLLVESDSELIGFIVVEHNFFGNGFIPLVCVAPQFQRRGIGLRLLAAAEEHCRTPKLFTSTNASNAAAQGLFARGGFVHSGTIENLDPGDPELVYFKLVGK